MLQLFPESRRAILLALKRRGTATIAELAEELRLTGEAIRQHLLQLQRDGAAEIVPGRRTETRRTGRPAARYRLSGAGQELFPKSYDFLTIALIDALMSEFGLEGVKRILAHVCDVRIAALGPGLEDKPLDERVQALKNLYAAEDPYMESESCEGGYKLIERNCPFHTTAMQRPALCSVSVSVLTRLLGVKVKREETFQKGDGRCVFRVFANEPIDRGTWTFRLESES